MSLSEQEQRALREIEQSLLADDPKFGASVGTASSFGNPRGGALTLRGVALVVVGLLMLVGGVALAQQSIWFIGISIVGFLLMFGSGVWMLRGSGESAGGRSPRSGSRKRAPQKSGRVSGKLEENFRRRFEEK
ncbi:MULTISPECIES: DUF3040 domain-containing protein [Corynebacterium]|uniref:DUF3040 domain-containing protein n=1 Tax=Corynebacterium TaxID=1716 RepID=UPI00257BCB59|nr:MULTISPECIES: DUF3040 domain-containing protein [Corynebacterium]MDN6099173.1 DUF3040 domain-containing protein [Corynebacterium flavescens]MDN6199668.1 DUF3040 domain-containing protein [Corynebacterium flavescens]MDN6431307.1 DUF3040 domain-containing protein [Corynebacterium flavescens]MDN6475476.1 DUF3040 domain-containing protein [Corynebacterium flavescens]MDN6531192.1 DUF3040 domain-containing protein [Corynebacterium flavescens]